MNLDLIKHLAQQYEDGSRSPEAMMAVACLEAYEQGFDDGVCEAEERMAQTQMLLLLTAGNA